MNSHIENKRLYFGIFLILLLLLALTIAVAHVDLGPFNVPVAMAFAIVKTLLVALFFMHLRHGDHLTRFFAAAGIFWLAILIAMTLGDFLTRGYLLDGSF